MKKKSRPLGSRSRYSFMLDDDTKARILYLIRREWGDNISEDPLPRGSEGDEMAALIRNLLAEAVSAREECLETAALPKNAHCERRSIIWGTRLDPADGEPRYVTRRKEWATLQSAISL